jgi:hypothetical protein
MVLCFLLGNGGTHTIGFLMEWVTCSISNHGLVCSALPPAQVVILMVKLNTFQAL